MKNIKKLTIVIAILFLVLPTANAITAGLVGQIIEDLYCKLAGCTMEGNIDMDNYNISNVDNLSAKYLEGNATNVFNLKCENIIGNDDNFCIDRGMSYTNIAMLNESNTFEKDNYLQNASFHNATVENELVVEELITAHNMTIRGNLTLLNNVCNATNCYTLYDFLLDTVGAGAGGGLGTVGPYLYNDTTFHYFNETFLNITIDAREIDTNASTICSNDEVLLGNTTCFDIINREWITPAEVQDIDDEDIEGDLNTYVDIAGDTMTGNLETQNITAENITLTSRGYSMMFYFDEGGNFLIKRLS